MNLAYAYISLVKDIWDEILDERIRIELRLIDEYPQDENPFEELISQQRSGKKKKTAKKKKDKEE